MRRCIEDRLNVADIAIFMHDFPSFSADIFLKRAFLFFALLDRIYGRAQALARQLPVAADYQLPKVLRAAGVLRYSETLAGTGDSCTAIEAGSREETEIRAGTIIADARLAMGIGVTETQVDDWLWQARNRVPAPHHRTRICAY